jgi:hypothetical protein
MGPGWGLNPCSPIPVISIFNPRGGHIHLHAELSTSLSREVGLRMGPDPHSVGPGWGEPSTRIAPGVAYKSAPVHVFVRESLQGVIVRDWPGVPGDGRSWQWAMRPALTAWIHVHLLAALSEMSFNGMVRSGEAAQCYLLPETEWLKAAILLVVMNYAAPGTAIRQPWKVRVARRKISRQLKTVTHSNRPPNHRLMQISPPFYPHCHSVYLSI